MATYQALHSAMNQGVGESLVEDTDDNAEQEHFDFQGFECPKNFWGPRFRDSLSG